MKPTVVLADTDSSYLAPLETLLADELREAVELEVITEPAYFTAYFSVPRKVDILVISEALYTAELTRQNIRHVYLLSEQPGESVTEDAAVRHIYKFSSARTIDNEIRFSSSDVFSGGALEERGTRVVLVYSPCGGAGTTFTAVGVAAALSHQYRSVLFVQAQQVHDFQHFLPGCQPLSYSACEELAATGGVYAAVKGQICRELFDYIPPFRMALSSLGLSGGFYADLVQQARDAGDYNFIVVDCARELDAGNIRLLGLADKVLVLVSGGAYGGLKTRLLLENVICDNAQKFLFVESYASRGDSSELVKVSERVGTVEGADGLNAEEMCALDEVRKLAYLLI